MSLKSKIDEVRENVGQKADRFRCVGREWGQSRRLTESDSAWCMVIETELFGIELYGWVLLWHNGTLHLVIISSSVVCCAASNIPQRCNMCFLFLDALQAAAEAEA